MAIEEPVQESTVTGRFAPSPTGLLHFGSLIAAVASYLQAKSSGGRWLIRVENMDPPREVEGSAEQILETLQAFGLRSDEPVLFQGDRIEKHRELAFRLVRQGYAYWCGCSRKDIPAGGVYPGTCRSGLAPGKQPRAIRLRVPAEPISFVDAVQGLVEENLQESCGDFVIWRADELPAYQLAVVADDAYQGVTEVVRGSDLLDSTARQIHLSRCLGLAQPGYAHLPVAASGDGQKLSKRLESDPVAETNRAAAIVKALEFLGHEPPPGLELQGLWSWAVKHWDIRRVPRTRSIVLN